MGGMRVLSLPYKGAPGLEGRAQQNQPNISSLIISTCVKTPQNEVIFFNYSPPLKIGFSSRIWIIFEQRSVSTECCGQEGMAAFLHSINESQIKCVPVSFPNVYLLHVFHFLLNIIIHNQMKRIFLYLFTCKTGFRYGRLSTLGKKEQWMMMVTTWAK